MTEGERTSIDVKALRVAQFLHARRERLRLNLEPPPKRMTVCDVIATTFIESRAPFIFSGVRRIAALPPIAASVQPEPAAPRRAGKLQPPHTRASRDAQQAADALDSASAFPSTIVVTNPRSSALRHIVAGVVIAVLTLAGVGRGLATASDLAPGLGVPGVAFHICHTGAGEGSVPADPAQHDCCDACALCAPITLADAPTLTGPASVVQFVEHAEAMIWVPALARRRTPRQSQGPPTA